MKDRPPVSCFCLTYARPHVLEEAIYSFVQQDYAGTKEMIVLNDYPEQTLSFNHPEVRVVNVSTRFPNLGEKMNAAVALASHDLLFPWDDDDIYLSHRLSFSVAHFEPRKAFFKSRSAWFWNAGRLTGPAQNLFHASSCWSRSLFDAIGGYAPVGNGCDLIFERELESRFPGSAAPHEVTPEEIYYLYRWGGTGTYHLSSLRGQPGQNVAYAEVAAFVQQRADQGKIKSGQIALNPAWKMNYPQLVSASLAALAEEPASAQE